MPRKRHQYENDFNNCPLCGDTNVTELDIEIAREPYNGELDRSILLLSMSCNSCGSRYLISYRARHFEDE